MSDESKIKKYLIVGSILAALLCAGIVLIAWVASSGEKDMYNTTEVKVVQGTIQNKEIDNGDYYLEVEVLNSPNSPYYIASSYEFYNSSSIGQSVGLLIGNVDTYKVKTSKDKTQLSITYSSSVWEALSLYPSLEQAANENQMNSFTTMATLAQRVHSLDGRYFFLMDAGGKKVMAEVAKEYYDRFTPATAQPNSFELAFEGYGEFNHVSGIVNPK
jgi:hypothetical protein